MSEKNRMLLRRALYCGMGFAIASTLISVMGSAPLYRLSQVRIYNFRGIEIAWMIESSLVSAGICVGTVLALRKIRLVPFAIVASLTIGLVAHEVARQVMVALHPDEYVIGLGEVGKLLDQYLGPSDYDFVNSFLVLLLTVLFCSMLSNNIRGFAGGFGAGLLMSLLMLVLSLLIHPRGINSMTDIWIVWVISIPVSFILGAVLGGSVALGEYLAVRSSSQSREAEITVESN